MWVELRQKPFNRALVWLQKALFEVVGVEFGFAAARLPGNKTLLLILRGYVLRIFSIILLGGAQLLNLILASLVDQESLVVLNRHEICQEAGKAHATQNILQAELVAQAILR